LYNNGGDKGSKSKGRSALFCSAKCLDLAETYKLTLDTSDPLTRHVVQTLKIDPAADASTSWPSELSGILYITYQKFVFILTHIV
jgi:hypothetical protein